MSHRSLRDALTDLDRRSELRRIDEPVDPYLEAAEIQRRVYEQRGPALLFTNLKGCRFPAVCNLFGTLERTKYLFRDQLAAVRMLVELKADPDKARSKPWKYWTLPLVLWNARPKQIRRGPILEHSCSIAELPPITCWPQDGGPFVTLPCVYTEDPHKPGWRHSNLGMYRVQLSGNEYASNEVGLHYQIHRGIGVHHATAIEKNERLKVNVIVGGPPALAMSAVMPLPEGMPELAFAGVLGGRRISLVPAANGLAMPTEADFVISGSIDPLALKPEGPFGDHLGYYSLTHDFPFMTVDRVHHRKDAIWPFTVVGRPPQEDTSFGEFIHELTGPAIPATIPGVVAVHAVDAAGVHPLLLAIGKERYVPYAKERQPQELLTVANAILGQGQLSLAKYLFIAAAEDSPPDIHDVKSFFRHILERFDPERDLHFHTRTTIDTLDYSANMGLNAGSKLVLAAAGSKKRDLADTSSVGHVVMPGVLAVESLTDIPPGFPLVVLVDDAEFTARSIANFLWVTFTRSDPARDVSGVGEFVVNKHWGCRGAVIIDATLKPHMPPPCEADAGTVRRVDEFFGLKDRS